MSGADKVASPKGKAENQTKEKPSRKRPAEEEPDASDDDAVHKEARKRHREMPTGPRERKAPQTWTPAASVKKVFTVPEGSGEKLIDLPRGTACLGGP